MGFHRSIGWRGLVLNVVRGLDVGDTRVIHDSTLCGSTLQQLRQVPSVLMPKYLLRLNGLLEVKIMAQQ